MISTYESLITQMISDKIGIIDSFLTNDLSEHLKSNLLFLEDNNRMKFAEIGNNQSQNENKSVRNDSIYWLDAIHQNEHEDAFLKIIGGFIAHLNMSCYAGITDCEFHYSLYEKGDFYSKHLDQFKSNSSRQYSMISYLNKDWVESDGGELMVHHQNHTQKVSPEQGKTVFFKSSELVHEVLETNVRRLSVTGWLKNG